MKRRRLMLVAVGAIAVVGLVVAMMSGSDRGASDVDRSDVGPGPASEDEWLPVVLDEDGAVATLVADGVLVLDEFPGAVRGVRSDPDGAITMLELDERVDVAAGSVLVSGPLTDLAPEGFILEVLEVGPTADGRRSVTVGPAGLEDVFLQADISLVSEMLIVADEGPGSLFSAAAAGTRTALPVAGTPRGGFGMPADPALSFELCSPSSLTVTGRASILDGFPASIEISAKPCVGVTVELSLQIRQRVAGGGRVSSMELLFGLSSELALDVRVAATEEIEGSPTLQWTAQRPLISGTTPVRVVTVGLVPVVHRFYTESVPSITVEGLGVELASTFRFDVEQRVTYRSSDGWSTTTDRSDRPLMTGTMLPSLPRTSGGVTLERPQDDIRLRGELQTKVQVILYGIAGPELRLKPGVEGVLGITPGACPNRTIVGDVPFAFGASIDRRVGGNYARMFSWIGEVELTLPTWTIGTASWPRECGVVAHRSSWIGIGGATADIRYDVGPVERTFIGPFSRLAGDAGTPESRRRAQLIFTLEAEMAQDLSEVPETFSLGLDDIIRGQLCEAIDADADRFARIAANLLLVDPETEEIVRPIRMFSGADRMSEPLHFEVSGSALDDEGLCTTLELTFERRTMWVEIDLDLAERIEANGLRLVLAPDFTFFPGFATIDFIAGSPRLWEREDWRTTLAELPTLHLQ